MNESLRHSLEAGEEGYELSLFDPGFVMSFKVMQVAVASIRVSMTYVACRHQIIKSKYLSSQKDSYFNPNAKKNHHLHGSAKHVTRR